jgi:hypothetical protein
MYCCVILSAQVVMPYQCNFFSPLILLSDYLLAQSMQKLSYYTELCQHEKTMHLNWSEISTLL